MNPECHEKEMRVVGASYNISNWELRIFYKCETCGHVINVEN